MVGIESMRKGSRGGGDVISPCAAVDPLPEKLGDMLCRGICNRKGLDG